LQQPPKFGLNDFEKMIEKAMKEAGEKPQVKESAPTPMTS